MNAEIVGLVAAAVSVFSFVPQIIKINVDKSSENVSIVMIISFVIAYTLWFFYYEMIHGKKLSIIYYFLLILLALALLVSYVRYMPQKKKKEKEYVSLLTNE